jgi:hypothetical protein
VRPEDIAKLMTEDPDILAMRGGGMPVPGGPSKFVPASHSMDMLINDVRDALNTAKRLQKAFKPEDPEFEHLNSVIDNLNNTLQFLNVRPRKRSTGELTF